MDNKRLLLIGAVVDYGLPASYARAFKRLGYDVFTFDSDQAYFNAGRFAKNRYWRRMMRRFLWDKMNLSTVEVARSIKPALVMAFKTPYIHAQTIRKIRDILGGVPFVNYYPDNPYCGVPLDPRKTTAQRRDLILSLREYDRVWIWERGLVERLRRDRVNARYLPFGVDPEVYHPPAAAKNGLCPECDGRHKIVFVGSYNDKRQRYLNAIKKYSVSVWGHLWPGREKSLSGRHTIHKKAAFGAFCAKLYSLADVSLNLVGDLNMPGHNMRTFEITASGGVMLSAFTKEQAEFFPEDEAAVYYRNSAELDAKIERILSDGQFRARLRDEALKICLSHSYVERAKAVLGDL